MVVIGGLSGVGGGSFLPLPLFPSPSPSPLEVVMTKMRTVRVGSFLFSLCGGYWWWLLVMGVVMVIRMLVCLEMVWGRMRSVLVCFVLMCFVLFYFVLFCLFGLIWFDLVWFGLVWFGLVWFGLVWFGLFCLLQENERVFKTIYLFYNS